MSAVGSSPSISMTPFEKMEISRNGEVAIGEKGTLKITTNSVSQKEPRVAIFRTALSDSFPVDEVQTVRQLLTTVLINELIILVTEYYCETYARLEHYPVFNRIVKSNEKSPFVDRIIVAPLITMDSDDYVVRCNISEWTNVTIAACQTYLLDATFTKCDMFIAHFPDQNPNQTQMLVQYKNNDLRADKSKDNWHHHVTSYSSGVFKRDNPDDYRSIGRNYLAREGEKWIIVTLLPLFCKKIDGTLGSKVNRVFQEFLRDLEEIRSWGWRKPSLQASEVVMKADDCAFM